jgi:small neutral amino acid transporter SnatA (MarC family)
VTLGAIALAFIPLFVAVDVVGLLPIYLGLTSGLSAVERKPVAVEATLTAGAVGLAFLLLGDAILRLLALRLREGLEPPARRDRRDADPAGHPAAVDLARGGR